MGGYIRGQQRRQPVSAGIAIPTARVDLCVAFRGKSMTGGMISRGRHVLDSSRVAPAIVKVEERTDRDGVVDRLVRPSCASNLLNVLETNAVRFPVDFLQELEERLLWLREKRGAVVFQHRRHQARVFQQFRRDRGVRADSKRARIAARGESSNEFPLAGRERRGSAHQLLREAREMVGHSRLEGEQVENLRDRKALRFQLSKPRARRPRLCRPFDILQENRIHALNSLVCELDQSSP